MASSHPSSGEYYYHWGPPFHYSQTLRDTFTTPPPVPQSMHSGHDLATALLQLAMLKENASSNSNVHAPEQFHVES